jgi:MerR family transcriptional regulator, light-induced transcriptional regulator
MGEQSEARHRIGAVVRLTGISAHALRAWERRYGLLSPERTQAGDRLYSEADVRRLRLIKRLTEYGHAVGSIALLDQRKLEQLVAEHTHVPEQRSDASGQAVVARYLDALAALDLESAERLLRRAALSREPADFIQSVADPLLVAVGDRWKSGELCVANEHAASAMLRTQLGTLLMDMPVEPDARSLVSATPAGERHEFGALFSAIIAGLAGWRAVYLGPDLPASEIATAVTTTGSRAALVSIVSLSARRARGELQALRKALPARVRLIAGGSGAAAATRGLAGVEHRADLSGLGELLTRPK